jgi:hypothetical protein
LTLEDAKLALDKMKLHPLGSSLEVVPHNFHF